ncbi:beta-lactamase [Candidatus Nitrosocosmicus sp.]|nr:beta-lactamase [Candidatus Nitrosocosmicus sp.]
MTTIRVISFILLVSITFTLGQDQLSEMFDGFEGTIVIYDAKADGYIVFNEERARIQYSPFSTYKIPNSLIALETGIVSDTGQIVEWDQEKYPVEVWWPESWKGKHNLRSAIKYSVVPFYRHLASQIGAERMGQYVKAFDYGNLDISSGIDSFWLNGSLKISAYEQITFLRKFYSGQLGVSSGTIQKVKSILVQETTDVYTLSAKTGGGYLDENQSRALGWFVGYVEKGDNVYYFALNIEGKRFSEIQKPRIVITKRILREAGIIQ